MRYLQEVRKHVGMMVPGPAQAAGVAALDDDAHVEVQRSRYRARLELLADVLADWSGTPVPLPDGAFYLWIPVDDGWAYTERLARAGGALVSPGEFYGDGGRRSSVPPWCSPTIESNWSPIDYEVLAMSSGTQRRPLLRVVAVVAIVAGVIGGVALLAGRRSAAGRCRRRDGAGSGRVRHRPRLRRRRHVSVVRGDQGRTRRRAG